MPERMPVLFIGHGSPMNAIADNAYTADLARAAAALPPARAILVVSAHWTSRGTRVTAAARPPQIYDFYGFPDELYRLTYAPPGSPEAAAEAVTAIAQGAVGDPSRGIDHAAWSPLRRMFPAAEMPVLELSLDASLGPEARYEVGRRLAPLREKGILIVGSGNIVHNLSEIEWDEGAAPYAWARDFDAFVEGALGSRDDAAVVGMEKSAPGARRAHPTTEHFLPLLYVLGAADPTERVQTLHASIQNGSISMRSFRIG